MARRGARDFMVGSFAAIALLILALAVMSVGSESELFSRSVEYKVVFGSTDGLRVSSPVKLAGVQVGSVRRISLPTDPDTPGIEVHLRIRREYAARIRKDSEASIRYLQWLSGEKFVEISPGSPDMPAKQEGTILRVAESTELLEQGEYIADNLSELTVSLSEILAPINRGEGLLGELIHDPDFGREGLAHLRGALENLEALTLQIRRGRGFLGRVLYDPEFATRIDTLSRTVDGLAGIMESLERREGALGDLLDEDGDAGAAISSLRASAASLRRVTASLESREGLVGRLLHDPEYSEGLAHDIREIAHNAADITRKINEGQGTLGALVNERVLYDSAEEVVAGVNDSKFARWLMRHYQKQGIELRDAPDGASAVSDPVGAGE